MRDSVDLPGLSRAIKADIYEHVFSNDDHEVGGVLVGTLGEKALPTITGSIAALEARGERASVTFTHDAWSTVHSTLERDFPGQQIVGWYHSHPGFGIFLSRHDLFIHENFFSDPRQVAYVVDPHAGTEGIFVWSEGKVVELFQRAAGRSGTGGRRLLVTASEDDPRSAGPPTGGGGPGTAAPGTAAPGTAAPGTAAPGTAAPGTAAPGTAAPGTGALAARRPGADRAEWVSGAQRASGGQAAGADAGFVRRAALLAAILGAMAGISTQLLLAGDDSPASKENPPATTTTATG